MNWIPIVRSKESFISSDWTNDNTRERKMPSRYGKDNTYQMDQMSIPNPTHDKHEVQFATGRKDNERNAEPFNISRLRQLKTDTFNFLEGKNTDRGKIWHRIVIFLIVISICLAVFLTMKHLGTQKRKHFHNGLLAFELILFLIFSAEYTLRIWSCSANSSYIGIRGAILFITRPLMILDLLVIISSITLIITLACKVKDEHWRYLFLLQLLRILRIDRQRGAFDTFRAVIRTHFKELLTCWYMGFTVIIFLSYLIYADPTIDSKGTVNDLANGLYWGVVSMTTIGYGDIAPASGLAKVVLCVFALVGAGFIAMPAGIIGSGFALQVIEQAKQKNLNKRRRPAAELIQIAWKYWASDLEKRFVATWHPHMTEMLCCRQRRSFDTSCSDLLCGAPHTPSNFAHSRQLSKREKIAVGFIRRLKYNVAVRNFTRATRPYDVKDILDKFAASHTEIFERLKGLRRKVDLMSNKQEQIEVMDKSVDRLEVQVKEMSQQLTDIKRLLEDMSRKSSS